MEISQGNSLCSYLYLKQAKMSMFLLFFLFSSTKMRTGGQNRSCLGKGSGLQQWEGEVTGKGEKRVNTMQKIFTHVCKCKNDTCGNYSRNGGTEG
jgi:hypothetical protein